ncbi:MAG: leucyl aminopeptidase [Magnetococcales bacterium]|nr:leucyl aminopeptidase [Magnetococcales bacterium]
MQKQSFNVNLYAGEIVAWKGDTIVAGVFEGGEPQEALQQLGEGVSAEVERQLKAQWMLGKSGESLMIPLDSDSGLKANRLLLVGLGKPNRITLETWRAVGGRLMGLARKSAIKSYCLLLALDKCNGIKRSQAAAALTEGAFLGNYRFDHYRDTQEEPAGSLKKLSLAVDGKNENKWAKRLSRVEQIAQGVALARDLGNQPGNMLNPEVLANEAKKLGEAYGIKTTILAEKSLKRRGMNAILAVGQGSANPPRLITMEYRKGGDAPLLAVVGKAVTFDSGGISLKPGGKMEEMKFDMSGGGTVMGFMRAIAGMELPINVVGIIPAAENMPSGTAQRPGDIIKTAKGVFVEVINTDAEGRLVLADALHHAESFKPHTIIDLATLTGACVVALGQHACGLMGNNQDLLARLQQAGEKSGERAWPLPLFDSYQEQIKSLVADVRNVGDRAAGTITAACFLSRFVEKGRPWAHLDIAGTAWDTSGKRPHVPKGSVGFGVRLLCEFVKKPLE